MKRKGLHFACLLGCILAAPAHAQFELGYAHVDEIDGETSSGFVGSWVQPIERWREYDVHSEIILIGIAGRDEFAGRNGDDEFDGRNGDDVFLAGAGLRKHFGGFFLGAGAGLVSQENEFLSTSWQFVTSLGYAGGSWALAYRHISNANNGGNNDGENLLSLSYRW
jgi:hypothetical protein